MAASNGDASEDTEQILCESPFLTSHFAHGMDSDLAALLGEASSSFLQGYPPVNALVTNNDLEFERLMGDTLGMHAFVSCHNQCCESSWSMWFWPLPSAQCANHQPDTTQQLPFLLTARCRSRSAGKGRGRAAKGRRWRRWQTSPQTRATRPGFSAEKAGQKECRYFSRNGHFAKDNL